MSSLKDELVRVLERHGVLFDGTVGHRRRQAIADDVLTTVRAAVERDVEPRQAGGDVKGDVLNLLTP